MTDATLQAGSSVTPQTLAAIYERAVRLAADRLAVMAGEGEASEFDRGARSVGTLVRTAVQVNALRATTERDPNDDGEPGEAQTGLRSVSDEDLREIRRAIEDRLDALEGIEGGDSTQADD